MNFASSSNVQSPPLDFIASEYVNPGYEARLRLTISQRFGPTVGFLPFSATWQAPHFLKIALPLSALALGSNAKTFLAASSGVSPAAGAAAPDASALPPDSAGAGRVNPGFSGACPTFMSMMVLVPKISSSAERTAPAILVNSNSSILISKPPVSARQ